MAKTTNLMKPVVTLKHIGINGANDADAEAIAKLFSDVLGLDYRPGNGSVFAGTAVEVMRKPYLGRLGHIAFGVDSIDDAEAYFASVGHPFMMETAKKDAEGNLKAVYLKGDFGGFAIHLLSK